VDPDLVHITLGEIAPLIDEVAYPTALMLFDSLTREIEGQLALETTRRRRAQLRLEHRRTRRFERDWYSRATGIASASTVDAAWFEDLTGRQVDVVETCVPAALFAPPSVERSRGEVMFVGSLIHPPNLDAIEWLSREIWPQIVASRPDAELHIVGRGDNGPVLQRVRALVEPIGGHIHADVDDIRPYYWRAAVAIAPVRLGAGLRNKVIHAMACHAPLVASPTALEGVPAAAAEHVLVGSAAVDLANAVLRALKDPVVASRRAAAAADAIQPLEASAVASRLEAWWKRTVG
jgi:glycosyltransferase involved in cell wall biosynthesis